MSLRVRPALGGQPKQRCAALLNADNSEKAQLHRDISRRAVRLL